MLMILVNSPGDGQTVYGPLRHAAWNGWTMADIVFPAFLWIVGIALTVSYSKRLAAGGSRARIFREACRRALILYALGLLIYLWPAFSTLRLMGVLQRIAICYLAASAIYLTTGVRGQLLWIVGLLAGYWLAMKLIPVPGFGPGRLDLEGNLAHYVDRVVLGSFNYARTKTWDPEGIVSTVPAVATTLFGILAGRILRFRNRLILVGILLVLAGLICDHWLPINKKLWTSSFALFMAGLDFVALAVLIWLIEERGYQRFVRPFQILGMNAIVVYMVSELLEETLARTSLKSWLYHTFFTPLAPPRAASLSYAIAYTGLMYLVALWMYRRGWIVRV